MRSMIIPLALLAAVVPAQVVTRVETQLLARPGWSWQFEPIRCTVRVTNPGKKPVRVRLAPFAGRTDARPIEIERNTKGTSKGGGAAPPSLPKRIPGGVLSNTGLRIAPGESEEFELEIRDLDALSSPAPLRLRVPLELGRDLGRREPPKWIEKLHTPWAVHEIRPHAGNAARLGTDAEPALREAYERLTTRFWITMRVSMNRGPFNPGPPSRTWVRVAPDCEKLLDVEGLSDQIRARALLGAAYDEVEQALFTRDGKVEKPLRAARKHLAEVRLGIQPPSGGLAPMLLMLQAHVDARLGADDRRRDTMKKIAETHPFFASLWGFEMRRLLN